MSGNKPRDIYGSPVKGTDENGQSDSDRYKMYDYDNTWVKNKPDAGGAGGDVPDVDTKEPEEGRLTKFADDYASNTSFHGIVWTRGAESIFGRIIWSLIVLGASSFLIFQISDRVKNYLDYPVTVDIQIKMEENLTFPAITICNTNAFKISKAAESGTYSDLYKFYINGDSEGVRNKSLKFKDMVTSLAHEKSDFIKDCQWKNENCTSEDFKEQLTDFGVCFTFNGYNGSVDEIREISQTGAQYGLHLLLNTEAYESMAGPNGYGGIKIQVHDPMADAQVQDLGLSIPPTLSAFVGLTMQETNFLEPPHGRCAKVPPKIGDSLLTRDDRRYTKTNCETECYAIEVNKTCSCVSSYMPLVRGSEYCTLHVEQSCAKKVINDVKAAATCSRASRCPYNCREHFYQAYVTYAALSESELIKQSHHYRKDIEMSQQYKKATVLRHQLVDELHRKEKLLVIQSVHALEGMMTLVSKSDGLNKSIGNWKEFIKTDIQTSTQTLLDLSKATTDVRHDFDDTFGLTSILTYLLDFKVTIQYGIEVLDGKSNYRLLKSNLNSNRDIHKSFCDFWENKIEDGYIFLGHLLPKTATKIARDWEARKRESPRTTNLEVWLRHAGSYATIIMDSFKSLVADLNRYANYMKEVYCVRARSTDPNPIFNKREKQETAAIALGHLITVAGEMNTCTRALRNVDEDMEKQSSEIYDVATSLRQKVNMLKLRLNKAQIKVDEISKLSNLTFPIFKNFYDGFYSGNPPSKIQMLQELNNVMNNGERSFIERFNLLVKQIQVDLEQFLQTIYDTDDMVTSTIMVMDSDPDLERVKVKINSSKSLQEHLLTLVTNFTRVSDGFTTYAAALDSRLRVQFNASIEIDPNFIRDNFIQISFYFQTLTYSTTIRQPGYTWFSLLCDCGGTAGLYLGASFLSIMELFYFIGKFIIQLYLDVI